MNRHYTFQKTILRSGILKGIGLHTGRPCTLTFLPADPNSGIRFYLNGAPADVLLSEPERSAPAGSLRSSRIGTGDRQLLTVEHLLASFRGLGLTNIIVEADGPEVPGLDGSALPFVTFLKGLGIAEQTQPVEFYRIAEPIFCYDNLRSICVYPADELSVSYTLDYDHPFLRDQTADFVLTPAIFEDQIAPARTFCTDKEAEALTQQGFGLGATPENTVVVREDGSHRAALRFPDECARHKVLDILGDLGLAGFPILGRVVGLRSGHALNQKLVRRIIQQKNIGVTV